MKHIKRIALIVFLGLFFQGASPQKLITYDALGGIKYSAHNDDYTVKVRQPGGNWQDLFEYNVKVDLDKVQNASMVSFDFEGEVELCIRKNNGLVNQVKIRPGIFEIEPRIDGNQIFFTINNPIKLSIEFNGDRLHNLHVFANSILKDKPDPKDPNVIYFGPGVHQVGDLPGDVFHVYSGQTVYVDGGAVIKGKILVDKANNVKIIGRGIIFQPERGVEIRYSKNVLVDGLIFINPNHYTIYGGQSIGLTVKNIKSFSCKGWSDGIDLMACSDVIIDDVFMRNSDDCIAIYGHRWDFYGSARNYQIKNSILWADVAHPTNIGLHGNAEKGGDTIENITFSNIDILEHDEDDKNYQGCLAISASDNNWVQNITYENIRVDNFQEGQLFNIRVYYNEKYSKAPGRGVKNVTIRNVVYNGNSANPSYISGYSDQCKISGVTIENLIINGESILEPTPEYFIISDFVEDINIKK